MSSAVTDASSYLRYLPPVLWEGQPSPPALPLGALLRIFEKILSGIDDDKTRHPGPGGALVASEPESIEAVIDRLPRLFDPWQAPARFLARLASWLGLELPPIWDEYQQRKAIAEIVQIYALRGSQEGLDRYLDLYTVAATRPRITVDDSAKVLFTRLLPNQAASVHTLVSQGPFVRDDGTVAHSGLVRPQCIALTPDGDLLIGDAGMPGDAPPVKPGIWRITRTGRYADVSGAPPAPQPLGQPGWDLKNVQALAIDSRTSPWRAYVLDAVAGVLYQLVPPAFTPATVVATRNDLKVSAPVAMSFDRNGHLLILDQAAPAIVEVDLTVTPVTSTRRPLTQVGQPRSLLVRSDGTLVIGDARAQNAPTPADLVLVDRGDPAQWQERPLLAALPAGTNPLVAPAGLVEHDRTHLLVLDIGLKPDVPDADLFRRHIAEPAAVFRVDIGAASPSVTRVSEAGRLVYPQDMILHEETLYIADSGEPEIAFQDRRVWRASAQEFGVLVHFSKQREPSDKLARQQLQRSILRDISEIVNTQKPAATLSSLTSSTG